MRLFNLIICYHQVLVTMSRSIKTNALVQGRNLPPKMFFIHVNLPDLWCHSKFLPHPSPIFPHMTPFRQGDYIKYAIHQFVSFSRSWICYYCLIPVQDFFSQSNNRIKDPFFSSLEHKVSYLNQHLNSYFLFLVVSKELGII